MGIDGSDIRRLNTKDKDTTAHKGWGRNISRLWLLAVPLVAGVLLMALDSERIDLKSPDYTMTPVESRRQARENEAAYKKYEARSQGQDRRQDENWQYFAQEEIAKRLKDPGSAQFRDVFISRKSGAPLVCGRVNGKNGYGGYAGFERFISGGKLLNILESDMGPGEMETSWLEFCGR